LRHGERRAARGGTGHRLYGDADVQRLQEIRSLRHLGFTLEEIRARPSGRG
jgi:DNA-binding transcriptional MerR regulator